MESRLKKYLDDKKAFFDKITATNNGTVIKIAPGLLLTNPSAFCRLLTEMQREFRADWMGTAAYSIFVPSQEEKASDPTLSEIEKHILKLRSYFKPVISQQELKESITFLLDKGMSHSEIAAKTGSSKATIYRLAGKKASKAKGKGEDEKPAVETVMAS